MASQVLSDVAPTDADRKSHDQMSKFVSDFNVCDTFGVQLSDCLFAKGKTFKEAVQCFDCIALAWDDGLKETFMCADLKETGYCAAVETCKDQVCDTSCSTEIENEQNCYIIRAGCDGEDNYSTECVDGI
jgi:hypothetical protein